MKHEDIIRKLKAGEIQVAEIVAIYPSSMCSLAIKRLLHAADTSTPHRRVMFQALGHVIFDLVSTWPDRWPMRSTKTGEVIDTARLEEFLTAYQCVYGKPPRHLVDACGLDVEYVRRVLRKLGIEEIAQHKLAEMKDDPRFSAVVQEMGERASKREKTVGPDELISLLQAFGEPMTPIEIATTLDASVAAVNVAILEMEKAGRCQWTQIPAVAIAESV